MSQYPEIDYKHVLSELSVNRKDPCEVIRELISNSYDARASSIKIYPLFQYEGFIFFDNGTGLSETEVINGITPYKAFFSIGKSTKIPGESIGYKCQGSKLCFASKKFTLITRCKNEENWRSISIDNPKDNLSPKYDIQSNLDHTPWQTIRSSFSTPNILTTTILGELDEYFFQKDFSQGTIIIIQGLEVQNFSNFYDSEENQNTKWSYLKHYIRYNTRHGDMRILRSNETGFSPTTEKIFKESSGYNEECKLYLWVKNTCKNIEVGYPYLEKHNDFEKSLTSSPANISRLNDGRFSDRGATSYNFEAITYCLTLAIDGNRRALDQYKELDRQRSKKSGLRLTDQRGVFICSDGVKICQYTEIFDHNKLKDYQVLNTSSAKLHYIFMINGTFDVVTNRTSLTEAALKTLNNDSFIEKIKDFLDSQKRKSACFRELLDRLNKENQDVKLDAYTEKLTILKQSIAERSRFTVHNIKHLEGQSFVEPGTGEEYSVGILYSMFAHFVTLDLPFSHLWLRPRTFSSMGIDSIAVAIGEKSLNEAVHKTVEYKYKFSSDDEFNHPLILTDHIVCWDMLPVEEGTKIKDSYKFYGEVSLTKELNGIGYEIIGICNYDGVDYLGTVKVISLKNLLMETFSCEWVSPPPKVISSAKAKGRRRSK